MLQPQDKLSSNFKIQQNYDQKIDLTDTDQEIHAYEQTKQSLEHIFNPFIRLVPETDWSKIKAIWIPFFHHDYKNKLEQSEKIKILQQKKDKFGTIQGYLTAPNENYIPYLTTFFNPELHQDQVIQKILQANKNILEIQSIVKSSKDTTFLRRTSTGVAKSGMLISIITNENNKIIDAFPIFDQEQI